MSEPKFKVGDQVRIIGPNDPLFDDTTGKTARIHRVDPIGVAFSYSMNEVEGLDKNWFVNRHEVYLEPVVDADSVREKTAMSDPKFKVGDQVRITGPDDRSHSEMTWRKCRVTELSRDGDKTWVYTLNIDIPWRGPTPSFTCRSEHNLELVEDCKVDPAFLGNAIEFLNHHLPVFGGRQVTNQEIHHDLGPVVDGELDAEVRKPMLKALATAAEYVRRCFDQAMKGDQS